MEAADSDSTQFEYECTFPGCATRYARKDAVKKHAKAKHPNWELLGDSRKLGTKLSYCKEVPCSTMAEKPDAKKQKTEPAGDERAGELSERDTDDEIDPPPELNALAIESWETKEVQRYMMMYGEPPPARIVDTRVVRELVDGLFHIAVVFENEHGRSQPLRIASMALQAAFGDTCLKEQMDDFVVNEAAREIAEQAIAGGVRDFLAKQQLERKHRLLDMFERLYRDSPDVLENVLQQGLTTRRWPWGSGSTTPAGCAPLGKRRSPYVR